MAVRACGEGELLIATGAPSVAVVLYGVLSDRAQSPLLEFLVFIVPHYVLIMHPGSGLAKSLLAFAAIAFLMKLVEQRRRVARFARGGKVKKPRAARIHIVDAFRASVILMVNICTFACDFAHFPARFMKTKTYGLSLMDVGAASFMMNSGIMSSRGRPRGLLRKVLPLVALGFLRLAVIKAFNYHVEYTEYGKHLNFYFTLAAVEVFGHVLRAAPSFACGAAICAAYEAVLLSTNLPTWLLSDDRTGLLAANKEGIAAVVPCTAIYLFSRSIGRRFFSPAAAHVKMRAMLAYTAMFFAGYYATCGAHPASRRLGNAPFVFFMMALHMTHLCMLMFLFEARVGPFVAVLTYFSNRMMLLFLLSNLLILAGNLAFRWGELGSLGANAVNAAYLLLVFCGPFYAEKAAAVVAKRRALRGKRAT